MDKRKTGMTIGWLVVWAFIALMVKMTADVLGPVAWAKSELVRALIPSEVAKAEIAVERMRQLTPWVTATLAAVMLSGALASAGASIGLTLAALGWGISIAKRAAQPSPVPLEDRAYIIDGRLVDTRDLANASLHAYSGRDLAALKTHLEHKNRMAQTWQAAAMAAAAALAALTAGTQNQVAQTAIERVQKLQDTDAIEDQNGREVLILGGSHGNR